MFSLPWHGGRVEPLAHHHSITTSPPLSIDNVSVVLRPPFGSWLASRQRISIRTELPRVRSFRGFGFRVARDGATDIVTSNVKALGHRLAISEYAQKKRDNCSFPESQFVILIITRCSV